LAALGISHIVLLLDNDRSSDGGWPGLTGTISIVENTRKSVNVDNSENVPIVDVVHPELLGQSKDPDSLVRTQGIEALRTVVDKREPAILFQARLLLDGITPRSSDAQRRAVVDAAMNLDRSCRARALRWTARTYYD
jgi:hypothetical protein